MCKILKGKVVSDYIKDHVKKEVDNIDLEGLKPTLAFVTIGDDEGTKAYIKSKKKDCDYCGIGLCDYMLEYNTKTEQLLQIIFNLNRDETVNGIIVGLPLPSHIDSDLVLSSIHPLKDIDCMSDISIGKMFKGTQKLLPCTPAGIIELLKYYDISIDGKNCVVVGRSNIVGKPVSILLLNNNGTVTVCHSKTNNLKEITKKADILVTAVGKANTITKDMVSGNTVVIDVGMNRVDGKLVGDVDFFNVSEIVSAVTPVPGGIGVVTRAILMQNTLTAFKTQHNL